ncbi:pantoate kinase [Methanoregula sp.]|uniref:pantoate kinase n=1 Tax=Methanoregula sp. TaxID=2052170 RepID=UPI0026094B14|nr:pantoate kinase [Methanoregula sp.]MDD5143948.1 pantoate kinase [Methanoregula sp.]
MKATTVTAFCPGHISGYFKRVNGATPASTGSLGAGIVIDSGVTATVTRSNKITVHIRRKNRDGTIREQLVGSPLIESVMKKLGQTVSIITQCSLPIGAGFGLSAAALLSTLTAVNRLHNLNLSNHDIAVLAHEAEVRYQTGLGDVAACQAGGWVVRDGPGIDAPIHRRYDLTKPIYAVSFGPIHTPSVLASPQQMERVASAFPHHAPRNGEDLFSVSQHFTLKSGLATEEILEVIRLCNARKIPASMTMLGNGVFAYGESAKEILAPYGEVYECRIAKGGPRITGVSL